MTESRWALKQAAEQPLAAVEGAGPSGVAGGAAGHSPAATASAADPVAVARLVARVLDSKKLTDVSIFEVRETLQIADYFVLASGINPRQIKAACDAIEKELDERGVGRCGIEGYREGKWVLLDYDAVVVHLFLEEQRRYYDLELLWGDSPKVDWQG